MEQPERRHVVATKIGADTWDDVIGALNDILSALMTGCPGVSLVSGGATHSYVVRDRVNPDVTHDSYFAALDEFLAKEDDHV